MINIGNSFNVFCARRRWLKRSLRSFLNDTAYFKLRENGMRIYFNPKDLIGPSFHLAYDLDKGFKNYEEIDKEEIVDHLPEHGIFVDVGANIGLFSLYVLTKRKDVDVYSFEPNSKVRACLESTKEFNQLDHLTIFSHAIGAVDSVGKLFKSDHNDGGHSLNKEYEQINGGEFEDVLVKPLSRELFLTDDKKVDVIKIDVEGAEKEVLEGALELIKTDKPMLLIEILNRDLINHKGVYQVLSDHFSDQITVRSPGHKTRLAFSTIKELATHNLSLGTEYNNYIFEFLQS
jgi:FkbM family methyltransferase